MEKTLVELKEAISGYNAHGAAGSAAKAIEERIDPLNVAEAAIDAIKQVGDSYGRGEAFLPELVGAANAMKAAMTVIEKELERVGLKRQHLGTVIIGTVSGDIHNIGKDMVATLAAAEGFQVIDLGVDVKSEVFMEAIRKNEPHILAMSALLTTTAREQERVIKMLQDEGLRERVKVVVGGAPITADFAQSIGADGYEPTAPRGIKLFKKLLGI